MRLIKKEEDIEVKPVLPKVADYITADRDEELEICGESEDSDIVEDATKTPIKPVRPIWERVTENTKNRRLESEPRPPQVS